MKLYLAKPREVSAAQVIRVEPLMGRNTALLSPDAGLVLVLDDGTKHRWLAESGAIPAADDYLVRDAELHHDFVVSQKQFRELFTDVPE